MGQLCGQCTSPGFTDLGTKLKIQRARLKVKVISNQRSVSNEQVSMSCEQVNNLEIVNHGWLKA